MIDDLHIYHRECFTFVSVARKKWGEKKRKEKNFKKVFAKPKYEKEKNCAFDANAQEL